MKYTLEMLMEEVGCIKYPERWMEIFEEAMQEYDSKGCYLTETEFYDKLDEKYGCFEKYGSVYKEAAVQVASDEALGRFLVLLTTVLRDDEHRKADLANFLRPDTPNGKVTLGYEMVTGLALCSQLEKGADNMRKRNIPKNIICETLKLAVNGVSSYQRKNNGAMGFDLLSWSQRHIDGVLFQIGRLQIEFMSGFRGKAVVFQNRDGSVVSLAEDIELHRDGFALGAKHYEDEINKWTPMVEETEYAWKGYPYKENGFVSSEQIVLNKTEWKRVLCENDPVIRLHIPPTGKMPPYMIDKSIEDAKKFANTYFYDYKYKAFACTSWLIDLQLCELLDENSNIVKFTKRFRRLTRCSSGEGVFGFVFNNPDILQQENDYINYYKPYKNSM